MAGWSGNNVAAFYGKTQLESPEQSDLGSRFRASGCVAVAARRWLFSAKRHHDLFVAASEDYPAVFDSFDRDLIDLSANLETKLLAFAH